MRLYIKTVGPAPKSLGNGVLEVEILGMPPRDTTGILPEKKALFASANGRTVSVQTLPELGGREELGFHLSLKDALTPYLASDDTVILGGIGMSNGREIMPAGLALDLINPGGYNVLDLDFTDPNRGYRWDAMSAMLGTGSFENPAAASIGPLFAADTIQLANLILDGASGEDSPVIYTQGTALLLAAIMMKVWIMQEATDQELAGCPDIRKNLFADVCSVLFDVKDAAALDKFMAQGRYLSSANGVVERTYAGIRKSSPNLFNNLLTNLVTSVADLYLTGYATMMTQKVGRTLDLNQLSRKKHVVAINYASAADRVHAEKIFFRQAATQALKYPGEHNVTILLKDKDPMWDVLEKMPCFR